jgi:hypothetical protein
VAFNDVQLIGRLASAVCLDIATFVTLKQAVAEMTRKEMTLSSFVAALQNFSTRFPAMVRAESVRRGGEGQGAVFLISLPISCTSLNATLALTSRL